MSKEEVWESVKKGFRTFIRAMGYAIHAGQVLTYDKAVQFDEWVKTLQKDKKRG